MATTDMNPTANSTSSGTTQSSGVMDKVKERAAAQLSAQKEKATDGLGSVAQMVRQGTQQLRDQQHDTLAGYVEKAADQIDRLSQQLRDKDVSELVDDAQRLARRRPGAFIGSAFALGVIGARFFKSSSSQRDAEYGGAHSRYAGEHYGQRDGTAASGTVYGSANSAAGYTSESNVGTAGSPSRTTATASEYSAPPSSEGGRDEATRTGASTGTRSRRSSSGTERS